MSFPNTPEHGPYISAFFHLALNRCLRLVMLTPLDQLENSEMIERRRGPDECFILESTLQ